MSTLSAWTKKVAAIAQENPGGCPRQRRYRLARSASRRSRSRSTGQEARGELGVPLETIGRTLETMLGSRIVTTFVKSGREYMDVVR